MTHLTGSNADFGSVTGNSSFRIPIHQILKGTAEQYPEKIALTYAGKEISYSELATLSDRFSAGLASIGVVKGDCVSLFVPNIPQFVIAYFGILKAGAAITAINPQHKEREVELQLADSEAKVAITTTSLLPIVENVLQGTCLESIVIIKSDGSFEKNGEIKVQNESRQLYFFDELLKTEASSPKISVDPDIDLAALQYTGGTTGETKAAMLTHSNLVANAAAFSSWLKGVPAKDVFLTVLPLSHIYGMTTSLNVPVVLGAKMVLISRFDAAVVLDAIQQHKVTVFCGVPTMFQVLLSYPEQQKFCLSSLRVCISGASPLPVQLQKKFIHSTGELLVEGYGLTEASPVTHCNPVDESLRTVKMGSIGLPLPGTEAKIVDAETGTKNLPAGEVGELVVRGPQVMRGYWKKPKETAQALRDGWLYTGDLARRDANGYFYITDRKKDIIKHNGYTIYPREIEELLYQHPAVKLCAVAGKADVDSGEAPKAFVVLKDGSQVSEKDLAAFVNQKLASYKALHEVEFRQSLPLGSAGKILKRALKEENPSR